MSPSTESDHEYFSVTKTKEVVHGNKFNLKYISCYTVISKKPHTRRMKCIRGT